jgi:hypothetical protein
VLVAANGNPPETTITSFRQVHAGQLVPRTVRGALLHQGQQRRRLEPNPARQVLVSIRNIEHGSTTAGPRPARCRKAAGSRPHVSRRRSPIQAQTPQLVVPVPDLRPPAPVSDRGLSVDKVNKVDPTRVIGRICVRNPGDNTCA